MSLVDVDSWITEYDACARLSTDIQMQIVQRKTHPINSSEYARLSGGVRLRLKQFDGELGQLSKKLTGSRITRDEEERRRRQIETLQSKLIHLRTQFQDDNETTNRAILFQKNGPSLWDGGDDDEDDVPFNAALSNANRGSTAQPPVADNHLSIQDLRRQQTRLLDDQDEGLDALAKIISRQKNLALRIGDEVGEQNDIIDDIAIDVERIDSRLSSETRHVRNVSELESSTFTYWVIIILLFVAIVVVAIL